MEDNLFTIATAILVVWLMYALVQLYSGELDEK